MSRRLDVIRDEALKLAEEERGVLAHDLWESFLTDEEREIQVAWIEVAEQRIEDLRSGKAKGIPAEKVMRELREKYGIAGNPRPGRRK